MRIVNMPHAVNKDSKEELLKPNEVRHKRNMRSGSTDSNHMGCCENIKGNVKIPNPHVNQVVEKFNIQTIADPYGSGLTSGDGSYNSGQTATVISTPISPNEFVNWTEDGVVSTESEYSFAVLRNRMLTANFVNPVTPVKYGLLYNWYAATDERNICAEGWEVPTYTQWSILKSYLTTNGYRYGGSGDDVGKSVASTLYWLPSATPGTVGNDIASNNSSGLNLVPGGIRDIGGTFLGIDGNHYGWLSTEYSSLYGYYFVLSSNQNWFNSFGSHKGEGQSIHPIKTTTLLTHGQTGTYTGNDGKVYRTICIGTQEWLADNLAETKYRNGDWITGFDGGVYTPISNATWAAATDAMCCAYEDNLANV